MIKNTIVLLATCISIASCEEPEYPAEFSVKVTDEVGTPLRDVRVSAGTFDYWDRSGGGFGKDVWKSQKGFTDEQGIVKFAFSSERTEHGINVFPPSDGYYKTTLPNYQFKEVVSGRWTPENPVIEFVLKKKRNPIPLYARAYYSTSALLLPAAGKACGFDLVASDWVRPYGKGTHSDLIFNLERRYVGVYDMDCNLTVTFGNKGDGFIEGSRSVKYGSVMRLDYLAPLDGYRPLIEKTKSADPTTKKRVTNISDEMNYFLRLRTVMDAAGKITHANYAKVHGDFRFDVINSKETSYVLFTYFFNPIPNDRNLEFDPKRNLFPDERINEP